MNGPPKEWRPRTWWQWLLAAAFPVVLAAFVGLIIASVQDDDKDATGNSTQTSTSPETTTTPPPPNPPPQNPPPPSGQFLVPGVVGKSYEQAQADIPSGLKVVRRDVDSAEAAGVVVAQSPGAQEIVAAGRTVTLDVSKGPQPDPDAGKEVFTLGGCASCHTFADAGATGTVGPNLDETQPSEDLVIERVTNGQGAMPSFKDQLTEQQIVDVAAYVSQVAGQ